MKNLKFVSICISIISILCLTENSYALDGSLSNLTKHLKTLHDKLVGKSAEVNNPIIDQIDKLALEINNNINKLLDANSFSRSDENASYNKTDQEGLLIAIKTISEKLNLTTDKEIHEIIKNALIPRITLAKEKLNEFNKTKESEISDWNSQTKPLGNPFNELGFNLNDFTNDAQLEDKINNARNKEELTTKGTFYKIADDAREFWKLEQQIRANNVDIKEIYKINASLDSVKKELESFTRSLSK